MKYKITRNKTISVSHKKLQKKVILIDAKDVVLGRLASSVVNILKGKNKATYTPNVDNGDVVVVTNCRNVGITGNKNLDKIYYHHTEYPGGLKERTPSVIRKSANPCDLVKIAVSRMLGKGPLKNKRMRNLHLFPDDSHNFTVKTEKVDFASLNKKNVIL
jgi:large subunit ribosomal protein L13